MSKHSKNYVHSESQLSKLQIFFELMIDKKLDSTEKIMKIFNCDYPTALNLFHRRLGFISNHWIRDKYSFLKKKRVIK